MKVLFYPLGSNPYQSLLIKKLRKMPIESISSFNNAWIDKHGFILGLISFPFRLTYFRIIGYEIFHLHWISPFIIHRNDKYFHKLSMIYLVGFGLMLKILNYKIIWTIHNLKSHEKKFIHDEAANKFLSKIADEKIVHSQENISEMKKLKYSTRNTHVVNIGNYIDAYENSISKTQARKRIGIKNSELVMLCFGRVEPYKGVDHLIEEFINLNLPKVTLLIVGYCSDIKYKKTLLKYKNTKIVLKLDFIPDNEVEIYFNAADVLIYPFNSITTSSSVILGLSFGKPIIAPLIGNIVDVPRNLGFFYNKSDKLGLSNSLTNSVKNKKMLLEMGDNALIYAKKMDWDEIAKQTYEIYKS